ncbi:tail fiber domain-containing protein [bacterium]|nr:tail fiber domain-containing protein [bacterium]
MKKLSKNLIAFTLSEMMIVLLIVSVISAATLPAITNKKVENPVLVNSSWQANNPFDYGHFYIGQNGNDVLIGINASDYTSDIATAFRNKFGNATLRLARRLQPTFQQNIQHDKLLTYGSSDIVFYDYSNRVAGKIAADKYGNIGIGKDALKQYANWYPAYGNFVLGHFAAYGNATQTPVSERRDFNTIVGNYAATDSRYKQSNVIIGNNTQRLKLSYANVLIGEYAGSSPTTATGSCNDSAHSVSIGYYSAYLMCGMFNTVNIGAYSGAYSASGTTYNSDRGSRFHVNIGSYAGNDIGISSPTYSVVNIGYGAGYVSYNNAPAIKYIDSISIGSYAGSSGNGSVNIGGRAGANQSGYNSYGSVNIGLNAGENQQRARNAINIGSFAGANSDSSASSQSNLSYYDYYSNINIGGYAGFSSNAYDSVYIGYNAGALGSSSKAMPTIYRNIAIGPYAGYQTSNTTHDNSIYIGPYALSNAKSSRVVIGCEGFENVEIDTRMCIGGKFPVNSNDLKQAIKPDYKAASVFLPPGILATSDAGWKKTSIWLVAKYIISYTDTISQFSDRTLKENIRKTVDGIAKVRNVQVHQFNFKGDKSPKVGVIAQELMKVYPNLVSETEIQNGKKYYVVEYDRLIYSLAQAVKDVDKIAVDLQKEVNANISLLAKLSKRIMSVENRLNNLSASDASLQTKLKEIDGIISKVEHK